MERGTIFAGFGGQGILFAGTVLAEAAVIEGREVSWMPSYGPEMRGGTASVTVIISERAIGSPILDRAEHIVVLNPPSLTKFEPILVPGGLLVMNSSLIEQEPSRADVDLAAVPCTAIARAAGDDRLAGVAALGALVARRPLVTLASIREALTSVVGGKHPELLDADLEAFRLGYEAALVPELAAGAAGSTGR